LKKSKIVEKIACQLGELLPIHAAGRTPFLSHAYSYPNTYSFPPVFASHSSPITHHSFPSCICECKFRRGICYPTAMKDVFFDAADPAHIRREKQKARELRQSQWWKRKRSTGICYYCKRKFPPEELTMDHLVPLARGGRTTKGNVVPCCKECNSRKNYLLPIEWQEYLETIRNETE